MKIFTPLYQRMLRWASHRRAPVYLAAFSFGEAFIVPIPPEVMLVPMCLSRPKQGFRFAGLSLSGSMLGAIVGYLLGYYTYELLRFVFEALGWIEQIDAWVSRLRELSVQSPWQTFWLLVLAGFTPIPLKIFTWSAGIVGLPLLPFLASMLVGRGKRVLLVALAIRLGGERAARVLESFVEPLGWLVTAALVVGLGYLGYSAVVAD
jgi:membrane protein YqaA with SNARE-associated domain